MLRGVEVGWLFKSSPFFTYPLEPNHLLVQSEIVPLTSPVHPGTFGSLTPQKLDSNRIIITMRNGYVVTDIYF